MSSDEQKIFQQVTQAFDSPAFARRARDVDAAWLQLLEACRTERGKLLELARLRLARLAALAEPWPGALPEICSAAELSYLEELLRLWQPRLRVPHPPARKTSQLVRAIAELGQSFERFNARWSEFVGKLDLTEINRQREAYNRYYVLEKECALRSPRTAGRGFTPLLPILAADLFREFPLLVIPSPAAAKTA